MTIQEAIDRLDFMKPNQYSDQAKIKWLSELDQLVWNELVMTHELETEEMVGSKLTLLPSLHPPKKMTKEEIEHRPGAIGSKVTVRDAVPDDDAEEEEEKPLPKPQRPVFKLPTSYSGYNVNSNRDTVLLVPDPYSEMYFYYLAAQVDLNNGETGKYNNSKTLFNNSYLTYSDYYTRTHRPKQTVFGFRL